MRRKSEAFEKFKEFCAELNSEHRLTLVAHPQSNGEAKLTNQTILQGLKARLTQVESSWANDLYNILWAYLTTLLLPRWLSKRRMN